jgi:hypothetical protein
MLRILGIKKINSIKSCFLSEKTSAGFSVFTNESLRKEFDEKIKEKYIPKHSQNQNGAIENEGFLEEMRDLYEEAVVELDEEGKHNNFYLS